MIKNLLALTVCLALTTSCATFSAKIEPALHTEITLVGQSCQELRETQEKNQIILDGLIKVQDYKAKLDSNRTLTGLIGSLLVWPWVFIIIANNRNGYEYNVIQELLAVDEQLKGAISVECGT